MSYKRVLSGIVGVVGAFAVLLPPAFGQALDIVPDTGPTERSCKATPSPQLFPKGPRRLVSIDGRAALLDLRATASAGRCNDVVLEWSDGRSLNARIVEFGATGEIRPAMKGGGGGGSGGCLAADCSDPEKIKAMRVLEQEFRSALAGVEHWRAGEKGALILEGNGRTLEFDAGS